MNEGYIVFGDGSVYEYSETKEKNGKVTEHYNWISMDGSDYPEADESPYYTAHEYAKETHSDHLIELKDREHSLHKYKFGDELQHREEPHHHDERCGHGRHWVKSHRRNGVEIKGHCARNPK